MNLVNGIGTLRNRLSDSHGRGGPLPVRPSPRHASLAVNTAGAVATFLVETHIERQKQGDGGGYRSALFLRVRALKRPTGLPLMEIRWQPSCLFQSMSAAA